MRNSTSAEELLKNTNYKWNVTVKCTEDCVCILQCYYNSEGSEKDHDTCQNSRNWMKHR